MRRRYLPDEVEDYLDDHDPEVHRALAESEADHRAGRYRPVEEFLAELDREAAAKQNSRRKKV